MMSYGLPVVASDGFGVRCMFQDGVNAYVASIGKREKPRHFEQNLREEVLRLWNDKAGQKKLRSNGYRILRERYSYAQMEKLYRSVFDRLFSASLDN